MITQKKMLDRIPPLKAFDPASQLKLLDSATDRAFGLLGSYQARTRELVGLWLDQSEIATRQGQKFIREWASTVADFGAVFPRETQPAEKATAEEPAVDKQVAQKQATQKRAAERRAAKERATEKQAAEELAADKQAAEKLAAEKLAAAKLFAEKRAAEKLPTEKQAAKALEVPQDSKPAPRTS